MTNSVVQLSNQIVLLEKHITTLETNTIQLSNYIANSVSHTDSLGRVDFAITVSTYIVGMLAIILTIIIFISVFKLFDNSRQQRLLEKTIEERINNKMSKKFDELSDKLVNIMDDLSIKNKQPKDKLPIN